MKNRSVGIDYVKGVCIVIVVISHTIHFNHINSLLANFFETIFLNAFFICSGWLYSNKQDKNLKRDVANRARKYITSYFILSAISILIRQIMNLLFYSPYFNQCRFDKTLIIKDIICTISFVGIATLWFLPILFLSNAYIILVARIKNTIVKYCVICISGIITFWQYIMILDIHYSSKILEKELLCVKRLLIAIVFVSIGYIIGEIQRNIKQKNWRIYSEIILLFILSGVSLYYDNNSKYFFTNIFAFLFLYYLGSIEKIRKTLYVIEFCGKNSLYIMVIHYIVILPVLDYIFRKLATDMTNIYIKILYFIITLGMSILATYLLRKNRLVRRMFG